LRLAQELDTDQSLSEMVAEIAAYMNAYENSC
jgi:hypothetical protein